MMVAGGETTDRGLANFIAVLLQHPDVLAAVRSDPALIDPAFSEFMRRDGVVVYEDRELRRDADWYGTTIPAGAIVRVALISANNDETVFADPRRFDLTRPDLRLGKESRAGGRIDGVANHLGFGLGKHFCIGYQLARAEIVTATPWSRGAHARHALRPRPGAAVADRLVPPPPRPPRRRGVVALTPAAVPRRVASALVEQVVADHGLVDVDAETRPAGCGDPAVVLVDRIRDELVLHRRRQRFELHDEDVVRRRGEME